MPSYKKKRQALRISAENNELTDFTVKIVGHGMKRVFEQDGIIFAGELKHCGKVEQSFMNKYFLRLRIESIGMMMFSLKK